MTNRECEESDGVRKVRLKTTSGVLTLRYRNSQSSREADNSPSDVSSVEKFSLGGSPVSGFGSLPELFEFSDQLSKGEGSDGCSNSLLDLRPDFSTYNFWASESGHSWPHAVGLPDTFSRCELSEMIDHPAPGLEPIVDDAHSPRSLHNCASKPADPYSQNMVTSSTVGEIIKNRKCYWDLPVELEEDIFECANYWNLLKEVTNERGVHGDDVVDDFLVNRTLDNCDDVANAENLDSDVLVYAPNRYLEDAACIFQSPSVDLQPDIEKLRTVGGHRIHDSQKGSGGKSRTVRDDCLKDGQSREIRNMNSDTTASLIEKSDDVIGKHSISESSGDEARVLRLDDFVNHRRRRFSALRGKRSKFPKRHTLTSVDKRRPSQASREIKPGRRVRSRPIRSSETARRLFKAASSSDSQSAEESHHNCEKTLKFSPHRDILNRSFNREAASKNLSSNPCLLRKKRTHYADVLHSPGNSKIEVRLHTESLSQDSPKKIKLSKANTPRDSPTTAQCRSPTVSRKKVRTSRRRCSPSSAKKLRFCGKIRYEGSSHVLENKPSQEREGQSETKSGERKGRRLPLPPSSVEILQGWVNENLPDPYPSREEKEDLVFQTGLKMSQIDNWLGNARQKLKLKSRAVKDICSESSLSPEQPKKQSKRGRSYPLNRL